MQVEEDSCIWQHDRRYHRRHDVKKSIDLSPIPCNFLAVRLHPNEFQIVNIYIS